MKACETATIEANNSYASHKDAVGRLTVKEKAVQASFATAILDAPKFEKYLTKVFKKKIKRSKKDEKADDDDDDDDEDEDDDDDDDDEEYDDEEDEEFDDTQCPAGLDQAIFDRVSPGSSVVLYSAHPSHQHV